MNLLLVEGEAQSFDVRLLRPILGNAAATILPSGGKDGFPNLVKSYRRLGNATCGLCDGDFPRQPVGWSPSNDAQPWTYTHLQVSVQLGWRWRRKEIENYLLDPEVLQRTYSWSPAQRAEYDVHLNGVLDQLGPATAARLALTVHAPRRNRVDTDVDVRADTPKLEIRLRERAQAFNLDATLDESALLATFHQFLPDCLPGGRLRAAGLTFFSGKNVAALLTNRAGIQKLHRALKSIDRIGDDVIDALGRDPAPHTWLPEWASLRTAVEAWNP